MAILFTSYSYFEDHLTLYELAASIIGGHAIIAQILATTKPREPTR